MKKIKVFMILSLISVMSLTGCGKEKYESKFDNMKIVPSTIYVNVEEKEITKEIENFSVKEYKSYVKEETEQNEVIIINPEDVEKDTIKEEAIIEEKVEEEPKVEVIESVVAPTPTPEPEVIAPTPIVETPSVTNNTSINVTASSDTSSDYINNIYSVINSLPDTLKTNLKTIDVTSAYGPQYAGLYEVNSLGIMHLSNSLDYSIMKATIYHEAAHGYDMSGETLGRFSNTPEFIEIYNQEWANTTFYGAWNSNEAFADAVALYYLGYNGHMMNYSITDFPLTYAYLQKVL